MKEPSIIFGSLAEVIKAVIPMLIIFGILHWTGEQVAQVMLVVGVTFGALNVILTRSQVTPTVSSDALIKTAVSQPTGTSVAIVKEIQAVKDANQ